MELGRRGGEEEDEEEVEEEVEEEELERIKSEMKDLQLFKFAP